MYRNIKFNRRGFPASTACIAALFAVAGTVSAAQPIASPATKSAPAQAGTNVAGAQPFSLKDAYEQAWARQPEAQSYSAREEAAGARRDAATSLTAEPPALELLGKSDRLNRNFGSREYEIGVALPLWLPGERSRSIALADAESGALAARFSAIRLRLAAAVREAYWNWQRATVELALAGERVTNAGVLAEDVRRRVRAGDLARADQHQADGNLAAAQTAMAESRSQWVTARQQLLQLTGTASGVARLPGSTQAPPATEAVPPLPAPNTGMSEAHPEIADPLAQAEAAKRAADLARIQKRANPELTISTTRDRGDFADPYQQSITMALRIPFGSDARYRIKTAPARADTLEAETQLRLARERVGSEIEAARQRMESARAVNEAASLRARLASETRGFFERSFRLGETDLPTRLRVELEAAESQRQAQRAQIDYAASISALRQALGLIPE